MTAITNTYLFSLLAAKSAIKLEKLGLKHSRGSVRQHWARHLGLNTRARPDQVIAAIEAEIQKETEPR
jgi:hypothetical protein